MPSRLSTLWIVATPIGNLGDISKRAIEVLNQVDVVACEDTRTTGNLLNILGISKKKLVSYYDKVEKEKLDSILKILEDGKDVALVSEAGSPVISDPGFLLVRECRKRKIRVSAVPGPSAPIAALMISGIEPIPFTFLGFMPRKKGDIKATLTPFATINTTLIFFERKSRLKHTLQVAYETLKGEREVAIVKELTKMYEDVIFFPLSKYETIGELKGEITVIISPPQKKGLRTSEPDLINMIKKEMVSNVKGKDLVERVLDASTGWSKKEVYNLYLRIKNG